MMTLSVCGSKRQAGADLMKSTSGSYLFEVYAEKYSPVKPNKNTALQLWPDRPICKNGLITVNIIIYVSLTHVDKSSMRKTLKESNSNFCLIFFQGRNRMKTLRALSSEAFIFSRAAAEIFLIATLLLPHLL